jgi:predicted acyl esterase
MASTGRRSSSQARLTSTTSIYGSPPVIPAGHRLRVTVASAAFPKYDRNLNTGGDNERDTRYSWSGSGFCMTKPSVVRAAADSFLVERSREADDLLVY